MRSASRRRTSREARLIRRVGVKHGVEHELGPPRVEERRSRIDSDPDKPKKQRAPMSGEQTGNGRAVRLAMRRTSRLIAHRLSSEKLHGNECASRIYTMLS